MTVTDVNVIGSGPNGLAAAVTMARAGLSVQVYEMNAKVGGGTRTSELTIPGFLHDVCSAVHPMAFASPFFREFGLTDRVEFVIPEISYGQAVGPRRAGLAFRSLDRTADELGRDGKAWKALFEPLVRDVDKNVEFATGQLLRLPPHLLANARFGLRVFEQGSPLWNLRFSEDIAPALLTGVNAHSLGSMPSLSTSGAGLLLATLAHTTGWPIPIGGSQSIANALLEDLERHGGRVITDHQVRSLAELPPARVTMLDTSADGMLRLAGDLLPASYQRRVRSFRYGNAASKVDFALSEPVPWSAAGLARTPTIHLGGDRATLAHGEAEVAAGRYPVDPYVLLSQPSHWDPTRAPAGKHVLWSYTHVPRGSQRDMTEAVVRRIEQFAPGFRDTIISSNSISAAGLEMYNPNYVGGDFSAGTVSLTQLFKRPVISPSPWKTPVDGLYLCSSSTPPGPGVHGMSGWYAAKLALRECFRMAPPKLQSTLV